MCLEKDQNSLICVPFESFLLLWPCNSVFYFVYTYIWCVIVYKWYILLLNWWLTNFTVFQIRSIWSCFFVFRYLLFIIIEPFHTKNWATPCDFQQCGILTSVDSDEPVQSALKLRNSKWCSVSSLTTTSLTVARVLKRLAKALIRLCVCAGWSEALLVAHTTLLEISCTGSNVI